NVTNPYYDIKYKIVNDIPDQAGEWKYDYSTNTIILYYETNPSYLTVYAPVRDSVIYIYNSSYVTLNGIEVDAANKYNVLIKNSHEIDVDSCHLYYGGHAAILSAGSYDISIYSDTIMYSNGNGIFIVDGSLSGSHDIYGCHINYCGESETIGDGDGWNYNGIYSVYSESDLNIYYNEIGNVGYCAINTSNYAELSDPDIMIYGNYIHDWSKHINDAGGVYVGGVRDNSTKIIRKNFIYNQDDDISFSWYDYPEKNAIYLDDYAAYWTVDSNVISYANGAIYNDMGTGATNNVIRNNIAYDFDVIGAYSDQQAMLIKSGAANYIGDPMTFKHNTAIMTDTDYSMGVIWTSTGTPTANSYLDSNYYFNPFRTGTQYAFANRISGDNYYYTLSGWQALTPFEDHSTYNQNSWTFADVSGITEDQFVWLFSNWSDSAHNFNLGNCVFKDTIGNNVSGTLYVPPYESKVLFYASGTINTVDDPFYGAGYEGGGSGFYEIYHPSTKYLFKYKGIQYNNLKYKGISYATGAESGPSPIEGLSDNLISWYDFENDVYDNHGSNNGTAYNLTYTTAGALGQGYHGSFNGSSSRVDLSTIALGGNTGTVNIWAKTSDGSRTWDVGMARNAMDDLVVGWSTGNFSADVNGALWLTDPSSKDEDWHMFTLVADGTNVNFYIDGASVDSDTYSTNWTGEAENWYIGCSSGSANFWYGYIDSVGLWSSGLTGDKVVQLFNSGAGVYYSGGEFYNY
ncbi:hypothetical protein JW960_26145, partial [candidate division KSB1 bacterium]|nr:hypothetical protein [candidate division KSB1 bacterium]